MLEIALGFFIALIVIISCTALAFLYPLTLRVSVSQGHVPLQTAPGSDDCGAPEVAVRDNGEGGHSFEYIEAVLITVKKGKDLRLRAEAMARVHSRLNIYVVLGLSQRRMRTQISLDNNSPQFNESFWVLLDREYDASQLLSMQVYHHSLHPSESDVRLGIAFMSLVSMKMSDSKDWKVVLGGAAACSRAPRATKQPVWPQ